MSSASSIACALLLCLSYEMHALKVQNEVLPDAQSPQLDKQDFVDFEYTMQHYIRDHDAMGGPHVTKVLSEDSSVPLGVWVANGVGAAMVVGGLTVMKFVDEKSPLLGLSAIVCYISLSCLVDININVAGNGHGVKFEPAVSVFFVEMGKLIVSLALYTMNRWSALCNGESFLQDNFRAKDVAFLSAPGALFALNNILIYLAIGFNDMASFGVFRDTVIFFNAMIWCFVFKSELGMTRLCLLFAVFGGLCINQVPPLLNSTLSWSVLLVLAMTLTNAFASVSNEYAIKQNAGLDLNIQNTFLYSFCSLAALLYIVVLHPDKLASPAALFANFDAVACLIIAVQLCIGLLVSRILKYADSVTKAVGSCLRGPIVVFVAPLIGLHSRLDLLTGISAVVVATAATFFLMQGRPAPGAALENKTESK